MPRKKAVDTADVKARIKTYLDKQRPEARKALQQIRGVIRDAAPDAVEVFSYGIPGFRRGGKAFLWYAGWKEHVSLYPIGETIRRAHAAAIKGLATSTGTIRFPLGKRLPLTLVRRLVKARLAQMQRGGKI